MPTRPHLTARLSLMMFLEYAARGVWYPYLANYLQAPVARGGLGFTPGSVGWSLTLSASVGAITSPLVAGQLADRYFNAERALGVLLALTAIFLYLMAQARTYPTFMLLCVLQSLVYLPTMALTNGVSFAHLKDAEHDFPKVRLWGTLAWLITSFLFPFIYLRSIDPAVNISRIPHALLIGAIFSSLLAILCFTIIPRTPPKKSSAHPLAFLEAFELLKHRPFLLLILVSLPVSVIHTAYYLRVGPFYEHAGVRLEWIAMGQITEIFSLFFLGRLLKRLGYRAIFSIGIAAFAVRFALFAIESPPALVIVGGLLHGVCFAFFFAAAYVFVEKIAPPEARNSAQTVFNLIALGIGPILTGFYNGFFDRFVIDHAQQYRTFWWTQTAIAVACLLYVLSAFSRRSTIPEAAPVRE
jgi:nucleoside transporter